MRANGVYYQYYSILIYTNPAVVGSNGGLRPSSPSPPAPTALGRRWQNHLLLRDHHGMHHRLQRHRPRSLHRQRRRLVAVVRVRGATASRSFSSIPPPDFALPPRRRSSTSPRVPQRRRGLLHPPLRF